jgi:hypothetical protein
VAAHKDSQAAQAGSQAAQTGCHGRCPSGVVLQMFYMCFTCVLRNCLQFIHNEGVMALVTGGVTGVASAHAANAPPPQPPACQVARKPLARVTCVLRCKKWASWKEIFIGVAQCCSSCSPAPLGGTRQDLYWSKFARDLQ